ncbi:MAG: EcsC family protein [Lachnospiraceae bacterium]|nr:EcsC family protein [Lachnospiraceae bacterium]
MSRFSWENEWRLQELKEESYVVKHVMDKTAKWVKFVEKKVPETLQNTLEAAFNKAFIAVFDRGATLIEKTYNKEKQQNIYKENEKLLDKEIFDAKLVKKFERQAKCTVAKNLAITSIEGVGMGLFGVGLPDIPVFVSVLLKSIYEISISYGFEYTTDREKLFILKMIDTSLKSGNTLRQKDTELNNLIEQYNVEEREPREADDMAEFVTELQIVRQIDDSAKALSRELLYGKFVQGMSVVGVVGGTADVTCLKRVTDYAKLKYKRRFLLRNEPC